MIEVVPIVEGHGEVDAVPTLLRRVVADIAPLRPWTVRPAIRVPRARLLKTGELERTVELAGRQAGADGLIVVTLDSDDDCPAELGPVLAGRATSGRFANVVVALACREFEAWFLASATSIAGMRGLPDTLTTPADPEAIRGAKEWLSRSMGPFRSYSPSLDQAALASAFSIKAARMNAPSFDRYYRKLEESLRPAP